MRAFNRSRAELVASLQNSGIQNRRVLRAFAKVPRHRFVSVELAELAYEDHPLPIKAQQTISQPYIVAYMLQVVQLRRAFRVLEVGTGSGYQTALLAELCRTVYTIELVPELAHDAATLLGKLGYRNVHCKVGDGSWGWPEAAPFDAILVSAAASQLPEKLVAQLKVGGVLVLPLQQEAAPQRLLRIVKTAAHTYTSAALLPVRFVPLRAPEPAP